MNILKLFAPAAVLFSVILLFGCVQAGGQPDSPLLPPDPSQQADLQEDNQANQNAEQQTEQNTADDIPEEPQPPSEQLQTGGGEHPDPIETVFGEVYVAFDFTRQPGSASNQYAVWIEDMDGLLIKTLTASRWTARGGYASRPDSLALWVDRSGLADMAPSEVDAVSGATPQSGLQSYRWDLTDSDGIPVSPGEYRVFIEGTLRWKNFVLFSEVVAIGSEPFLYIQADPEFHYESSGNYDALTAESPENEMISGVTVIYTPIGGG